MYYDGAGPKESRCEEYRGNGMHICSCTGDSLFSDWCPSEVGG